jgi:hypothetical protein
MHELRHYERVFIKKESHGFRRIVEGGFRETGGEVDAEGLASRSAAAKSFSQCSEKMGMTNSPGPT